MLRVEAGHYRDTCRWVVYDVKRINPSGWTYKFPSYPGIPANDVYPTKGEAKTAARMAIYAMELPTRHHNKQ